MPDRAPYPRARKRFGQHFLRDRTVLDRIVAALAPRADETVVEIGPGRGALTDLLVPRAARLVAVELDRDLAAILRDRYAAQPHVAIVEADVLSVNLGQLAGGPFVVAGNVPYYITTPILFQALQPPRAERAVFLVQREVAERVSAPPGSKEYGALSVNVQGFARPETLFRVPPSAFSPPPTVDSAVIRVTPLAHPVVGPDGEARFRTFVQAAFGLRRKQMRRVLRTVASCSVEEADAHLAAASIDPEARPETLSPADFARIVERLGVASR